MVSKVEREQIYHDGFLDGQQLLIDAWNEVHDQEVGRTEAYERFKEIIEDAEREIASN